MLTKREEKPKFRRRGSGRNLRDKSAKASSTTAMKGNNHPSTTQLMEAVVERGNMILALRRVESNGGSAGTDGMEVGELRGYLKARLAGYKVPRAVVLHDSLPRNETGKVVRAALGG